MPNVLPETYAMAVWSIVRNYKVEGYSIVIYLFNIHLSIGDRPISAVRSDTHHGHRLAKRDVSAVDG